MLDGGSDGESQGLSVAMRFPVLKTSDVEDLVVGVA
jgi:hypothetical protein